MAARGGDDGFPLGFNGRSGCLGGAILIDNIQSYSYNTSGFAFFVGLVFLITAIAICGRNYRDHRHVSRP
jgi:hypothetical protein